MKRIQLSLPHMGGGEELYIREAFATNFLSTVGPNLTAFEDEFRAKIGLPAVALSSGTAAIHLGLRLLDVGPGDEVFCPTLTFVATANPILYLGARPVFLDSEYASWNLDPALLVDALRERARSGQLPKAVIAVHLFGQCADMDAILGACEEFGIPVLEDAAEALGASYKGRAAGVFGKVAAFSFNGNKIITTTGGGMLVSADQTLVDRALFWSMQARDPGVFYQHSDCGYNYRMSNVLAGIGRGQLQVLDLRVHQRQKIASVYRNAMSDVPGILPMPQAPWGTSTNWLSCFLVDAKLFGCTRDELIEKLDRAGIESRPIFKPMHLQPLFSSSKRYGGRVAEDLFARGICLPSSSNLSPEDQLSVINEIRLAARRTLFSCAQTGLPPAGDPDSAPRTKIAIYGSGTAGMSLLREIRENPELAYDVVGFFDDDFPKGGISALDSTVFGPGNMLSSVASRHGLQEVFIAIPSATSAEILRVIGHCRRAGVRYRIMPHFNERIRGAGLARQIRQVKVEDILGRASVRLNQETIRGKLAGKTVLVTGAGGAIGAEVCRQIVEFRPKVLVGFDLSATALFHIERELHEGFPQIQFHGEIGDIQNASRVFDLIGRYRPAILYHAAAYEHAPMMERHPLEAIENNIFGTLNVAAAARDFGVADFVMVSSDKALRPTSIMGATKRIAEIIIRSMSGGATKFVAVRFGSVLGGGSVVPLFKEQIAKGGPVTVTQPDMQRCFMTIQEASQLVLQASTMGKGGEIFVLDMGGPVRIVDLAETLIELSGLHPHRDIQIAFSGKRPGEEMDEEFSMEREAMGQTDHDKIRVVLSDGIPESQVEHLLRELQESCRHRDVGSAILKLREIAHDYQPSNEILEQSQREKYNTA